MEFFSLPPDELERRHEGLNAALDELVERGEPEPALEAERALVVFWMTKGRLDEGRQWLERLLAAGDPPANLRAAGPAAAGVLAFRQGDDTADLFATNMPGYEIPGNQAKGRPRHGQDEGQAIGQGGRSAAVSRARDDR